MSLASEWLGAELALRLPALLASVLLVPVAWALGANLIGRRGAVLAATLAAGLPVLVLEGAEARGYSMMILAAALATWAWLTAWAGRGPGRWCLYAFVCAAGAWAHPLTVFVPAGHALWLLWRHLAHSIRLRDLGTRIVTPLLPAETAVDCPEWPRRPG